jgi:hypothetical protein
MAESKSAALPLGYAPMPGNCLPTKAGWRTITTRLAPINRSVDLMGGADHRMGGRPLFRSERQCHQSFELTRAQIAAK